LESEEKSWEFDLEDLKIDESEGIVMKGRVRLNRDVWW